LVIITFVLYPLGAIGVVGDAMLEMVFSLLLITGVMAVTRNRTATVVICFIAATTILSGWLSLFYPSPLLVALRCIFLTLSLALLIVILLIDVFREGPIDFHRIQGAIAGYLLVGILWAHSYRLVALLEPSALVLGTHPISGSNIALMHKFIYFSFTTLTTIGLSEITPINPLVRSLVIVEALIGQLYPAILLARLVSMEVSSREPRSRKSDSGESSRQNRDQANQQRENLPQLLPTRSKHAV